MLPQTLGIRRKEQGSCKLREPVMPAPERVAFCRVQGVRLLAPTGASPPLRGLPTSRRLEPARPAHRPGRGSARQPGSAHRPGARILTRPVSAAERRGEPISLAV